MRIIRYLKEAKLAVFLIVCLLILQAFAELSLPRYTAAIVNTGIQQSGIEHASPEQIRAQTFDVVCMFASDTEEAQIRASYTQNTEGNYALGDISPEMRDELDQIMALPLVVNHFADELPEVDLAQITAAYDAGLVTKEQIREGAASAGDTLGAIDDSLVVQQAIQATITEYEALGVDLPKMQMDYLLHIGLIMLGLAFLAMAVSIVVSFIASRTAAKTGRRLRSRVFSRVVSFSDAEVQGFSAASLITRGTNDIQQIQMVTVFLLRMLLYAPILAIGGIIMITNTNVSMNWIIILAVGIIVVVVGILFKVAMPKFRIMQSLIDQVNLVSREILTGLPVVRAFGRQDFEEKRFDDASTVLMKTQLFVNRAMSFMFPLMMLIMNGVSVLIVWVGGSYIDAGTIQTGDMIAFINYAMVIIMSFLMLSMMAVMLPRADVAAGRINEVINTQESIHDPASERARDREIASEGGASIAFDRVSFAYPDAEANVLTEVSFEAAAGKTTAFVGSTGSGKSTIIKLIERFYDVTQGSITLDGIDIRELTQATLRANFGYVPQKAFLFSGTIQSNIAYSDAEMADERVVFAADVAQSQEFIDSREEKFAAEISQGGTNVSGGQRQRLAIARALASDARAFLFDDSFSALDFKTDAALRSALATNLKDKTVLIVAQRISTIMQADQIVVLENGQVVGIGTHAQLMDTCEAYREIATSQLSEEELGGGDVA
ncbi:MAG: ABC transporter ATP-binding protein/permease [Eggerthellaceae bacterium]|jgi:ATP-binding cassette subfamily B protein|nr:ABC transporter ATP-binding protein/permease [Eggerthellaceae bacterium]MDR2721602.1 ABC transporter ATP-binding protein/permease [Coriobacteriaceae bacterium]